MFEITFRSVMFAPSERPLKQTTQTGPERLGPRMKESHHERSEEVFLRSSRLDMHVLDSGAKAWRVLLRTTLELQV